MKSRRFSAESSPFGEKLNPLRNQRRVDVTIALKQGITLHRIEEILDLQDNTSLPFSIPDELGS
jgi:hypothetical protein